MPDKPSAPALQRGIQILRLLEPGDALTLEAVAARTAIPKASALRLLQTLQEMRLVDRRPDKSFVSRARLVPVRDGQTQMTSRIAESLRRLCAATGHTAEWYVPSEQGMILVQRQEPDSQQVHVVARIGFVRAWHDELDAVACVGIAFGGHGDRGLSGFWVYDANGNRSSLTARQAQDMLSAARRDRMAMDRTYNTNGVRRTAVAVACGDELLGVLAVAGSYRPGGTDIHETSKAALAGEMAALSS